MTLYPFCGAFATKKEERSASLAVKLLVVVTVELGLTDGLDFFLDVKALFQCGVNGHQAQQAGQPQAGENQHKAGNRPEQRHSAPVQQLPQQAQAAAGQVAQEQHEGVLQQSGEGQVKQRDLHVEVLGNAGQQDEGDQHGNHGHLPAGNVDVAE